MGFDDRGKVRLNMKYVNQDTGEEYPREEPKEGDAKGKKSEKKPRRRNNNRRRRKKSSEEE